MITIVAVGKLKEKAWKELSDEYVKRISSYSKVEIIEVADETTARELAKWNLQSKKAEIGVLLDKANEEKLDEVLKLLRA